MVDGTHDGGGAGDPRDPAAVGRSPADPPAGRSPVEPIPGPEAFEQKGRAAELSQAAFILSAGAGAAGKSSVVPRVGELGLPSLKPLAVVTPISVAQAIRPLSIDRADHAAGAAVAIPAPDVAPIARKLVDDPRPKTAATLVEASLHNPSRVVRTAAAAAALDTTGVSPMVEKQLVESSRASDETTRGIARVALGRIDPAHPALAGLTVAERATAAVPDESAHTAVLTHGTFAALSRWWRPGNVFWNYLDGLPVSPPLHMYAPSFQWSGDYSDRARDEAAEDLGGWLDVQGLSRPDFFAHSHGVTVANLVTQLGVTLDRLVMLSWPVRGAWLPDLSKVRAVIDIRVRMDLVILADRGGQRLPASVRKDPKVREFVNGWFEHGCSHEPAYWQRNGLSDALDA